MVVRMWEEVGMGVEAVEEEGAGKSEGDGDECVGLREGGGGGGGGGGGVWGWKESAEVGVEGS